MPDALALLKKLREEKRLAAAPHPAGDGPISPSAPATAPDTHAGSLPSARRKMAAAVPVSTAVTDRAEWEQSELLARTWTIGGDELRCAPAPA